MGRVIDQYINDQYGYIQRKMSGLQVLTSLINGKTNYLRLLSGRNGRGRSS